MKEDKGFVIMLSIIALVLGGLLIYYFYITKDTGFTFAGGSNNVSSNKTNNGHNSSGSNTVLNVDPNEKISLERVTDYNEFFNVNELINTYFELITRKRYDNLLDVYDKEYINEKNIKESNIASFATTDAQDISFYSREMYRKGAKGVRYYFVNGEENRYDFTQEEMVEKEGTLLLVTIDYNNEAFSVMPIETSLDLFTYAQNYDIKTSKRINKNDSNNYHEQSFNDEIISTYYINYYKNLLYLNTQKAYNMLDDETKSKYPELENFSDDLENIYNMITPNIFSYSAKGNNGKRTYSVIMNNEKEIKFKEKTIMDFNVGF